MKSSALIENIENFLEDQAIKEAKIRNEDMCIDAAEGVVKSFVKENLPIIPEETFYNSLFGESNTIKKLLEQPKCKENLIFNFHIRFGVHGFAIVKINDGTESHYRLYHSWKDQFTLGEWLGIDPWPASKVSELNKEIHKKYNKTLTLAEITEFMEKILKNWEHDPYARSVGYKSVTTASVYEFDPLKCSLSSKPTLPTPAQASAPEPLSPIVNTEGTLHTRPFSVPVPMPISLLHTANGEGAIFDTAAPSASIPTPAQASAPELLLSIINTKSSLDLPSLPILVSEPPLSLLDSANGKETAFDTAAPSAPIPAPAQASAPEPLSPIVNTEGALDLPPLLVPVSKAPPSTIYPANGKGTIFDRRVSSAPIPTPAQASVPESLSSIVNTEGDLDLPPLVVPVSKAPPSIIYPANGKGTIFGTVALSAPIPTSTQASAPEPSLRLFLGRITE